MTNDNRNGYTFHLGAGFDMTHLDAVCNKLGTTRPNLIKAVMIKVFNTEGMLEQLGADAKKARTFPEPRLPVFKAVKSLQESVPEPVVTPRAIVTTPLELHPLQSRKTLFEPLPEPRPAHYHSEHRPSNYTRAVVKTKNQLRNELREAVENTSRMAKEMT